jgi:HlyD family secretion protein
MKMSTGLKRAIIPVILVVGGLIAWGLTSWGRDSKAEYRFVEVTRGDVRATVSSTGTLQAIKTVAVGTQVSGEIAEIYVDFNDHVEAGQLVARIDPKLLKQAVSAAEADVERSEAELVQAQGDLDRIERLFERQVATESERATATYKHAVAQAGLKSARINLDRARQNLSYSEIRSPISGIVLSRDVDAGQTVAASFSAPQLFVIAEDLSAMEILASVDESDIGQIQIDQRVEFTVQAYSAETFTGAVSQIRLQPTAQENVVNYTVLVRVANPDGRLLPGMTATVDFIVTEANDVLRVPNSALRFRPTGEAQLSSSVQRPRMASRPDSPAGAAGDASARAQASTHGGSASANTHAGASRSLLWYVASDGKLAALPVRTGSTDGQYTEVEGDALQEGMQVIAAVTSGTTSTSVNPFETQRGQAGGPPGHPPGM